MSDVILNHLASIPNLQVQSASLKNAHLVSPENLEALSQVMQNAYKNQWRIIPSGSGSKLNWGGIIRDPQIILSTQNLNKILDYAVSDLTVTVESGLKLRDLQKELAKFNQFLPIDPAYSDQATLGGIVATGDTGSYRKGYGGVRDLILGLSWIRSDGEIAKAGGKVVKNVAGYDMMKLFTGSYGTLGVINSITFRLYPLPPDSMTVLVTGEAAKIKSLVQFIRQSSLTPSIADILSSQVIEQLNLGQGLGLILRFQTISESILEQIQLVKEVAGEITTYQGDSETDIWQLLKQTIRQPSSDLSIICKIGIPGSQATTFLASTKALGQIHLSSGVGYLQFEKEDLIPELRAQLEQGFLSILEAPLKCKEAFEPWGYKGNALEMMRRLEQQFDPLNILSPGRFLGKI